MASWRFVLTDATSRPVGEVLNAQDRQVAIPLNRLDTASFKVRLDNPLADYLVSTSGYVKGYRDSSLLFHGPIISAAEVGDANSATVAVNCVGAGWILQKRLAGKSSTGTTFGSATDRAQIIKSLIDTANSESETGIDTSGSMTSASAVTYTAGPFRPITEIITELSSSLDGFDWRIFPSENYVSGAVANQKIGQFYAAPIIGSEQPNAVFEWGTGRCNMASYTRTVTRDTQANKVYHFTSAGPDAPGYPTVSAIDSQSITDWKLLEDLVQADLLNSTLRQRLVDEHVNVRKNPRQVIQFDPHVDPQATGRLPQYGTDYGVGDAVRARAAYGRSVRFDAMMRVWGVTFNIDSNGLERATLTLADES